MRETEQSHRGTFFLVLVRLLVEYFPRHRAASASKLGKLYFMARKSPSRRKLRGISIRMEKCFIFTVSYETFSDGGVGGKL